MYAIVSIAGQQFKVEKNSRIFVHRLQDTEGSVTEFDKVLLIDNDGKILLGDPYLKGALVTAKVISHMKGDKVKVFKKKRRKGYRVLNGHRQYLTEIIIDEILEKGSSKKASAQSKVTAKTENQVEAETTEKKETKAAAAEKQESTKTSDKKASTKATSEKETKPEKKVTDTTTEDLKKAANKADEDVVA